MSSIKTFTAWINEARRPEWKDSDAPDANGRFRDLGIKALAKWLISSRKGDMRKITGSLNQQIVFNRGDNPAYAKKMEKVREEVKRQLKKNEAQDPEQWEDQQKQHQVYTRLQDLGLADSPLAGLEEMLIRRRWKWEKLDGNRTYAIELTRWEAESTYLSRMGARHQKKYPNTYYFSVTDLGAETGMVRILWYSSKDSVKEVQVEANPEIIIRAIDQRFNERSVD